MTDYMLALFSTLIVGLWLFRVRALKHPSQQCTVDNIPAVVERIIPVGGVLHYQDTFRDFVSGMIWQGTVVYPSVGVTNEAIDEIHAPDSASARARRQGTSVPGLFSKAPKTKLELVII